MLHWGPLCVWIFRNWYLADISLRELRFINGKLSYQNWLMSAFSASWIPKETLSQHMWYSLSIRRRVTMETCMDNNSWSLPKRRFSPLFSTVYGCDPLFTPQNTTVSFKTRGGCCFCATLSQQTSYLYLYISLFIHNFILPIAWCWR